VEELGGLLWAWLGAPENRPMVPRWEAFVKDGIRDIGFAVLPCNWLQIMENSLDPVHLEWLHAYFSNYILERLGEQDDPNYWRTPTKPRHHAKIGFDIFEHGIIKRRVYEGDDETHPNWAHGHPVCFPNMLRQDQIRVPMDDTHTLYIWYLVHKRQPGEPEQKPEDMPIYQVPLPGVDAQGLPIWEVMDNNSGQDNFAWQSQGPVTPRWTEHLGESDKGIILYRRLLREQMKIVEDGGDPMNTFRDPATNVCLKVPSEYDAHDATERGVYAEMGSGSISAGQATKYSPVAQQRAREAGRPLPKGLTRTPVSPGYIHPREA
jgi:5,5'-dehydrodivanillate O-demethylase oxygenase subunit